MQDFADSEIKLVQRKGSGGKREGAGRKNKAGTNVSFGLQLRNKLVASGFMQDVDGSSLTPLEVILYGVKTYFKLGMLPEAVQCASVAAPFVHPRLSAVAVASTNKELTLSALVEAAINQDKLKTISAPLAPQFAAIDKPITDSIDDLL